MLRIYGGLGTRRASFYGVGAAGQLLGRALAAWVSSLECRCCRPQVTGERAWLAGLVQRAGGVGEERMEHGDALDPDGRAGAQATVDRGEHCLGCRQLTNVWSYCRGRAGRDVLSPAMYARPSRRDVFAAAAARELSRPQREHAARPRVNACREMPVEFAASPSGNQGRGQVYEMH